MATNPQTPGNIYFDTNGVPANGILGGIPVAEQNQDYLLIVKRVTSTTPEIINQTQYAIEYIVGGDILEGGNIEVRTPNQSNETNADIIQNFPPGKNVVSQLINATSDNTQLSGELNVTGVGTLKNILYSQTGIPSSSYSTESVVFITPGGAPVGSSNEVENILGGMISSSAFTISNNTFVQNYTVTTQTTAAGGTNFNGPSGKYFVSSSDLEGINYVTFKVSYQIQGNTSNNVDVEVKLSQGSNPTPRKSDVFTVPRNQSVIRNFSITIPKDNILIAPITWGYYYKVNVVPDGEVTVQSINFEVTSTSPQPPANIPAGDFWSTGSDSGDTWLTGSTYLSLNYSNLQDTSNFTAATKNYGLDPINTSFELQKGDKIRFGYTPSNTFTIYDIITPSEASDGLLKLKLNRQVPNNIIPDNFIIYRIDSNEPKYIILDVNKTSVIGDPENPLRGYIFPKYPSSELKKNRKQIQQIVTQQGLI